MLTTLSRHWNITRQYSVLYKPETDNYDALNWKVDFKITKSSNPSEVYFVEAKGDWIYADKGALAELQHKIQFLEFVMPFTWQHLILVGETKPRILDKVQSFDIQEFKQWLKSLCPMKLR